MLPNPHHYDVQLPLAGTGTEDAFTELRDWVFPGLFDVSQPDEDRLALAADQQWIVQRAILAPRNDAVDDLNHNCCIAFPGDEHILRSADFATPGDGYPVDTEFLNTLHVPNLPAHELTLKPRMPLILLRNIDPLRGLCNGTRLSLLEIHDHFLYCRIITGDFVNEADRLVYIPRLRLSPDEHLFPFQWSRCQFPVRKLLPNTTTFYLIALVRVAFVMTVNKAQGQTLAYVGVYLRLPCFTHGQLYVAASRVGHPNGVRFAGPGVTHRTLHEFCTPNIVFREVLDTAQRTSLYQTA
eukprot:4310422-Prymnesium_polylepis.1